MFKKVLIVLIISCFLFGWATKAETENVEVTTTTTTTESTVIKSDKGYKIEVSSEQGQTKEIKFVSPEGKNVRTIPYETWEQQMSFKISPASNYVLSVDTEASNNLNLNYLDRAGNEKWAKTFTVEGVGEEDFPSHGIELSKDGSSMVIYTNHELGYDSVKCDITVLDTLGKEKVSYSFDSMIETGALQISPDGKIIGADTYKKGLGKCLFFLDVESVRAKTVKTRGEGWSAQFSLPPEGGTPLGKVAIRWGIYEDPKNKKWVSGGRKYLTFEEIPSDLSTLFGNQR